MAAENTKLNDHDPKLQIFHISFSRLEEPSPLQTKLLLSNTYLKNMLNKYSSTPSGKNETYNSRKGFKKYMRIKLQIHYNLYQNRKNSNYHYIGKINTKNRDEGSDRDKNHLKRSTKKFQVISKPLNLFKHQSNNS